MKKVSYALPKNRLVGGVLALSTPVVYMVAQHIGWMSERNQKISMALKQSGFWGGFILSALTVHRYGFWAPKKAFLRPWFAFIAASSFPILGYQGGHWLTQSLLNTPKAPQDKYQALSNVPKDESTKPNLNQPFLPTWPYSSYPSQYTQSLYPTPYYAGYNTGKLTL